MIFEYDKNKSKSNKLKHNIDFQEAQKLWEDLESITIKLPFENENRQGIIATLNNNIWTGIFTERNQVTRLISVRRARQKEKELYYDNC